MLNVLSFMFVRMFKKYVHCIECFECFECSVVCVLFRELLCFLILGPFVLRAMPAQLLHEWFHFRRFREEWLAEHPGTPVLDIIRKWNSFRDDPDIQKVFSTGNDLLMLLPVWREVPFSVSHDLE